MALYPGDARPLGVGSPHDLPCALAGVLLAGSGLGV
jgi:hypothetical protein